MNSILFFGFLKSINAIKYAFRRGKIVTFLVFSAIALGLGTIYVIAIFVGFFNGMQQAASQASSAARYYYSVLYSLIN